jgi:uncharacterized protein with NAD-binding domain and iron-sulfur cluster
MTTALWLTEKPGWQDEYEITVYQLGWRLGGKGASGRDMRPGYGHRILEHGLHIWLGFYDNAFFTMRQMQAGLAALPTSPVQTFPSIETAFTPQSLVTVQERFQGKWVGWPLLFPPNLDSPGQALGHASLSDLLQDALGWIRNLHDDFFTVPGDSPLAAEHHSSHPVIDELLQLEQQLVHSLPAGGGTSGRSLLSWAHALLPSVRALHSAEQDLAHGVIARALGLARTAAHAAFSGVLDTDLPARRFFTALDLGCSLVIGVLEDGLLSKGFESADGEDFRQWLRRHGAQAGTVDSAPVEVIYDLVFGFRDGDTSAHDFAAGTCVRGLLRMLFGYRGNLMFKMNAGMGDTIFTPFYALLKARGVRFEFFTRVLGLELDADDPKSIATLRVQQQATVKPAVLARGGYEPLVRVGELDCWPAQPDFSQLVEGDALQSDPDNPGQAYDLESSWSSWPGVGQRELRRGEHFDLVVLGISIGALPELCAPLLDANVAWRTMVETVRTTPTQSAQFWLNTTAEDLGWDVPEFAREAERTWRAQHGRSLGVSGLVGAYENPTNTWADMSHLLPEEDWPKDDEPKHVGYLVGPLPAPPSWPRCSDHGFPRRVREQVTRATVDWIDANAGVLFPKARTDAYRGALDPEFLIDPGRRRDADRFAAQYYRANIDPTERYVLSVAGSTAARIAGGRSGFVNLVLTGDWTYNRVLNAGCVEATVASGMEAAQSICGYPKHIVGDSDSER